MELKRKKLITEKESKNFNFKFKEASNLGKFYLLAKIQQSLFNVPGCPVSSNCGTPTEKASKFLNHHLQSIIKSGESYVKYTNDYLGK